MSPCTLRVSAAELIEEQAPNGKPGPTPEPVRQIEQVGHLPKARQKSVSDMLETILRSAG